MTRHFFILTVVFLNFAILNICKSQNKITFKIEYDTIARTDIQKQIGPIQNRQDSACIIFDSYFNGLVTIFVDNKAYSKQMTTDNVLGYSGYIMIPKVTDLKVILELYGKEKFNVDFDKRYCTVHVDFYDNKVSWTYVNHIYEYE